MKDRMCELLERLVSSGPKCHAISASETHEVVDLTLRLQQKNDELVAHVERLREWANCQTLIPHQRWEKMFDILQETPAQSLNHIRAQLQQENDELRAHVERLREAAKIQAKYTSVMSKEFMAIKEEAANKLLEVYISTPSQSLNHILAQVEEETIERCVALLFSDEADYSANQIHNIPRKYKEQDDK